MTAWEYRNGPIDVIGACDLGADGWELVTVYCPRPLQAPAERVGIYKRPVTPADETKRPTTVRRKVQR